MAEIEGGERAMNAIRDIADKLKGAKTLSVGFLDGATYPDGTSVALVAAVQNFGSPKNGIPPRPFFSNMVAEKSPAWGPQLATLLPAVGYDSKMALEQMGQQIAGDLRQSIVDTNSPGLKPATIRRKGFEKPLVDSGHMLQSVDYEVVDN